MKFKDDHKSAALIKQLLFQNEENQKRAAELVVANKELLFQIEEKEKRAQELIIANKELVFQNTEKEKRVAELVIANEELALENNKKEKRAAELIIANKEPVFQTIEQEKHPAELVIADKKVLLQNAKREKPGSALAIANKELITILENSGIGLILLDQHCRILQINNNAVQLCELAVGITFKKFDNFYSTVPDWRKDDLKKLYSKVMNGENLHYESVYPRAGETKLILNVNFIPTRNNEGDIIGACLSMEDITERKNSEKKILENENRFRVLIESSVDMKMLTTREGKVLYCSPSVEKSLGYSVEEFLHIYPQDLIHPDSIESYLQKRDDILKTPGKSFEFRQRRIHKNGSWIWCEGIVTNLLDKDGIHALVSNFRDITERKVAEQAIIESEKNIRTLAESMPQMVWMTDAGGQNTYFNHQWVEYTGLSLEESYGDGWLIPFHEDDKPIAWQAWNNAVIHMAEYTVECRLRKYDGSYHWWLIRGVPEINEKGEIGKWYGTCTNIEKIKQAEERLRKSEVFNREVLNSLSSHIAVVDGTGTIVSVNEAWQQFALDNGETALQRTGVGSSYFDVCRKSVENGEEFASDALKGMMDVLEGKQKDFYLEYPCHSPGEQRWFGMRVKKFESNDAGVVVAHMNITERRLAENKLIDTSNELQQALNDITKIMDSSLDVICVVDENGIFKKVSAASESVWGYKPGELIGKPIFNFVHQEDDEITKDSAHYVMEGNNLSHFENRYIRKDGSFVNIEWSARWDAIGKVRYGVARDVTEKKKLKKAFEIERQQFFDLFSETPSSMGILSGPDHRFEMANPPCLQLIGKKDIIGKPLKDVLPEIMQQGFIEILDGVYQTGKTFYANEILIKLDVNNNGEPVDRYLNLLYQPHKGIDGKTDGILFFAVDVTEQVLSRKKIEESEATLKAAQATAHMGSWQLDFSNNALTLSEEGCRIVGFPEEENQLSAEKWMSLVHHQDINEVMQKIKASQETLQDTFYDHRIILKDGTIKHIHSESKFEWDANGKPIGMNGTMQDITERKLAEEEIQKLATIVQRSPEFIGIAGLDAKALYLNDGGKRILDLNREITDTSMFDFIASEDIELFQTTVIPTVREKGRWIGDIHLKNFETGAIIPFLMDIFYVLDSITQQPIAYATVSTDITERKLAEDKLYKSEARLREAQAIGNISNWDINLNTNHTNWSDELYNILGLNKDKVQPSTELFFSFIHPDDIDQVKIDVQETLDNLKGSISDFRFIRKDGTLRYAHIERKIELDQDKKPIRLYGILQDTTVQKKAELIIVESEARLAEAQALAKIGNWETDLLTRKVIWSAETFRIFELKPDNFRVSHPAFLEYVHPEDREKVAATFTGSFVNDLINSIEHRIVTPTGLIKMVEERWQIIHDDKGNPTLAVGTCQDITERKNAEVKLEQQNKELAISNAELEQFAYVASHDLQEPLRMVTGFLTQLEKKYGALMDDKGRQYINFAVDGAKRMRQIILDLLEFSRVGRTVDNEEDIDLNEVVNEIKILFRKETQEKKAEIISDLLPRITGYRSPIRQVFQNLISNALKYTLQGSSAKITINCTGFTDHWQFAISDNGIGIDPEYFEKIFIIFQRLHTREEFSGTGMGLAITKKIIENQGGKIWVESEEGKGSTFYFTIPKAVVI